MFKNLPVSSIFVPFAVPLCKIFSQAAQPYPCRKICKNIPHFRDIYICILPNLKGKYSHPNNRYYSTDNDVRYAVSHLPGRRNGWPQKRTKCASWIA